LKVPIFYFGMIFALFNIISAIGSSLVDRFEKLTKGNPFLIMGLMTVLGMFLIGRFPSLYIFPLWSLFSTFVIMNQTLISDKVLALIPSERAATILSFQNLIRRLIYAGFGPFLGFISDRLGIGTALQMNAVVLFLILAPLFLFKKKFFLTARN